MDMEIIKETLGNGNVMTYAKYNGTCYEKSIYLAKEGKEEIRDTAEDLILVLDRYLHSKKRVRFWYGDKETGRSWNEEYDVTGHIGRTTGDIKIPIVVHNARSCGGMGLLTGSIIRIDDIEDKRTLWQADNFHVEKMEVRHNTENEYCWEVWQFKDSGKVENIANFKKELSALHYIDFQNGKRYCK